jgi:3-oxoacyl-[acyl-carrier-protein] synthase II
MLAVQPTPARSGGVPGLRVAITGLGVVGPCGVGRDAFWNGLLQEATGGIRRVEDFDATWLFGAKEIRRCDRFTQFAAVAAAEAIEDAGGVDALHVDPARAGVFVGIGVGGLESLETQIAVKMEKGSRRVSPFLVPMMMPNASTANISMRYGFRGPCENTATACAAGTHSVGNGARLIATGRCDVVLAGSSEAVLTDMGLTGFRNMTALSTSGVSMPFDRNRDGFVISEGGAVLMLEELEHARARGAHIYAELAGAASNADAYDITAPSPGGAGAAACMEQALVDAELSPSDITHINAHGTSTSLNDAAEAEAITKVFGTPGPLVTSIKGVTGHALGAAGALEAVALVLTMHHRLIPPTFGLRELDPEMHIRVVTGDPEPWEPGPAMSNSFGFGGHNGSIVVIPPTD